MRTRIQDSESVIHKAFPGFVVAILVGASLAATASSAARGWAQDPGRPTLDGILASAAAYMERYERELSAIVAEEEYLQRVSRDGRPPQQRRLRSDFLMVKLKRSDPWVPFRDVFEVNGVAVRDRDLRLKKLFLETPDIAASDARRITDESARYNIGSIQRNINVPTLPLTFLQSPARLRFRFRVRREHPMDGARSWEVEYVEHSRPTLIKGPREADMPVSGSFWIDPRDGSIRQTRLHAEPDRVVADIVVVYCAGDLPFLAPCTMTETYRSGIEEIRAQAKYSKLRRFQVLTDSRTEIKE